MISAVSKSARGLVRDKNEDSVLSLGDCGVYAVADGMGGGEEGEKASRMIVSELENGVRGASLSERVSSIGDALERANAKIFAYASERGFRQMGSTVALVAIADDSSGRGAVCHIGDSRIYRIRGGAIELLTRDHSVGAELEERVGSRAGSKFAVRSNPLAHLLTRAIGTAGDVSPEWRKIDVCDGDRFIVCSDGVHDVMDFDALLAVVGTGPAEEAAARLEREVLAKGAPDNYSFILVDFGGRG